MPEGQSFYDKKLCKYNFSPKYILNAGFHFCYIVDGFFNFARCVLKNGKYSMPTSVSQVISKGIDVKLAIEEKAKKGGYRCVTLKVFDYKGGDFVENQDLTMVVVDERNKQVLCEVPSRIPLC